MILQSCTATSPTMEMCTTAVLSGLIAFFSLHALAVGMAHVRMFAHAGGGALAFQAFLGHLRVTVDQESRWCVATGHAVQLTTALLDVHFAITGALCLRFHGQVVFRGVAIGGRHADALLVFQVTFLAEASDHAVLGADGAWMWVGAGGWASSAACTEDFVGGAFHHWWHHGHQDWVEFWALFGWYALAIRTCAEMALFAGASADADARANWIRFIAGAIASLALTEFFVFLAFLWWKRDGL